MDTQASDTWIKDIREHKQFHRFFRWLTENFDTFDVLIRMARDAKAAGEETYSFRAIWEVARYDQRVRLGHKDDEGFALNNSLVPLVARAVLIAAPDLGESFFEFREVGR